MDLHMKYNQQLNGNMKHNILQQQQYNLYIHHYLDMLQMGTMTNRMKQVHRNIEDQPLLLGSLYIFQVHLYIHLNKLLLSISYMYWKICSGSIQWYRLSGKLKLKDHRINLQGNGFYYSHLQNNLLGSYRYPLYIYHSQSTSQDIVFQNQCRNQQTQDILSSLSFLI